MPLEERKRQASYDVLQTTLYELISQYHAVQQSHWNVQGPLFYSLHDLLGELYGELGSYIDVVAERKIAIGTPADGRPSAVAQSSALTAVPEGFLDDKQVLDLLTERHKTMSDRLYPRIEETGVDDPVIQDLLIDIARTIDTHLWMLRAFVK